MNGLIILLWLGNIFFDTVGQLAFKGAAVEPDQAAAQIPMKLYWLALIKNPLLWLGVFSYVAEFLLWLAFLTLVPLSEGILLGSINIIVIMVFGRIFYKEKLSLMRIIGISLVAIGVAIVGAL